MTSAAKVAAPRRPPQAPGLQIVRILRVEDTRTWEEQSDDRFHPIPGSGTLNECGRCGRSHEVWAHVLLSDGTERVFGTGCAQKVDAITASRIGRLDHAAKRLGELKARRARLAGVADLYWRAHAEVEAMTPPTVEVTSELGDYGRSRFIYRCGDAEVWGHSTDPREVRERRATAESCWRDNRIRERAGTWYAPTARIEMLDQDIARTEKRMALLREDKAP